MNEIFVRFVDFPPRVKGITTLNPDGTYNVYINAKLSYNAQQEAIDHELAHIERNHIYDSDSAISNERELL